MILLTPKELIESFDTKKEFLHQCQNIAKAQAKKIAEWGEEKCPHSKGRYFRRKRCCEICWHELEQEIK